MLETKIEELTKAIEALTLVMQSATNDIKTDVKAILEQTIEPVIAVEPAQVLAHNDVHLAILKTLNYKDLRNTILQANRIKSENKVLIKEMLTKYGATKVSDVAEQDIQAVIEEIERLTK
tara:strand:+ start:84 stop:443 length:360 start_codon:yes stop_codon:yes gene_type:complete